MKLKTPLFLALVIGPILAIILVIWPDIQVAMLQQNVLAEKQALVDSIKEKNQNMKGLTASLADPQNSADKEFVLNYIPLEKREEVIFNSINNIANAEGVKVALSNVGLKLAKEEILPVVEVAPAPSLLAAPVAGEVATAPVPASVLPQPKKITAEISIVGSYQGQKNFIAKLYALDMMKGITSFDLTAVNSGEGGARDLLNSTIGAEFTFIPEAKIGRDYNNAIFSQKVFDFASVEKIKTLLSQKMTEVTVGEAGRTNPFLP
jgi:hypothetical protein